MLKPLSDEAIKEAMIKARTDGQEYTLTNDGRAIPFPERRVARAAERERTRQIVEILEGDYLGVSEKLIDELNKDGK
ncbi:hypothetical protein LCGC14_0365990 [marine sediment metagenome]|uniref:Uncharacterized protein n=1 Tax=marine sediment metagenome TaxID=412755 RepID=A0A0F9TPR0_9ZZZZ